VVAAFALLASCTRLPSAAPQQACPTDWVRSWSSDSLISVCLPSGFPRDPETSSAWMSSGDSLQPGGFVPVRTVLWVERLVYPEEWETYHSGDPWPATLRSGPTCISDCEDVDSLVVQQDTIAGVPVHVEEGSRSNRWSGRNHLFIMSWAPSAKLRIIAHGQSTRPLALDTLRAAALTLRIVP